MKTKSFAFAAMMLTLSSAWAGPISGAGGGPLGTLVCGLTDFNHPAINLTLIKSHQLVNPMPGASIGNSTPMYYLGVSYGDLTRTVEARGEISGAGITVTFADLNTEKLIGSLTAKIVSSEAVNGSDVPYLTFVGPFLLDGVTTDGAATEMKCSGQW